MSHFTVLVVTKEFPSEDVLTKTLQPFHEFECTGTNDEYVQTIDETDERLTEWEKDTTRRYQDPEGNLHDPYADHFYREVTPEEEAKYGKGGLLGTGWNQEVNFSSRDWNDGKGYRAKIHFLPEGWQDIQVPTPKVTSFADWLDRPQITANQTPDIEGDHKFGYTTIDAAGQVIATYNRTNPNDKWDWWQVGGRWSGQLLPKVRHVGTVKGTPGLLGSESDPKGVDICQKINVNFEAMRDRAIGWRTNDIDKAFAKCIEKNPEMTVTKLTYFHEKAVNEYKQIQANRDASEKKEPFWKVLEALPEDSTVKMLRDLGFWHNWSTGLPDETSTEPDLNAWAMRAPALSCFAFLRDGKWAARGDMGWWASVSNENEDWDDVFPKLLADVPDDHWLTIVDCHI